MIIPRSITWLAPGADVTFQTGKETQVTSAAFRNIKFTALPDGAVVQVYFMYASGNKSAFFPVKVGDVYENSDIVTAMYMKTDTVGATQWQSSETDTFRASPEGQVVIVGPVTVTGAVDNTPVGPDLMTYTAAGADVPLQTANGQDLAVGGFLILPGVFGKGQTYNTKGAATIRMVVQASGNVGDFMTVFDNTDQTNPPVPIYDQYGRMLRKDGRVYFDSVSPAGTVYYINVRGIGEIGFAPGAGTPVVALYICPFDAIPKPNANQLNYSGAITVAAAGANLLLAGVAGWKIRVFRYRYWLAGAAKAYFASNATQISASNAPAQVDEQSDGGLFETVAGESLNLVLPGASAGADCQFSYLLVG